MKKVYEQLRSLQDAPDLDMERLSMICSDNVVDLFELGEKFVEGMEFHLKNLKENLEKLNYEHAFIEAHNIKGSSATFGANSLRSIAVIVEKHIQDKEINEIPSLIEKIEVEFQKIKSFFKNINIE